MKALTLKGRDGSIRGVALVDDADYARLSTYRWRLTQDGYVARSATVAEREAGAPTSIMLHREVLGLPWRRQGLVADHINNDRLDNRRTNLRTVTNAQNAQNRPRNGGWYGTLACSGYRGVHPTPSGKFVAYGTKDGKRRHLGTFGSELDAAVAACAWRLVNLPYTVEDPTLEALASTMVLSDAA